MRTLDRGLAGTILLLGVVHAGLTPFVAGSFDPRALWFFAAGLSLVFLGMLNLIRVSNPGQAATGWLVLIGNVLGLGVALAGLSLMPVPQNPQVPVLVAATLGEIVFSIGGLVPRPRGREPR